MKYRKVVDKSVTPPGFGRRHYHDYATVSILIRYGNHGSSVNICDFVCATSHELSLARREVSTLS